MKRIITIICSMILAATVGLSMAGCTNPFEEQGHVKDKVNIDIAILNSDNEMSTVLQLKAAFEQLNPGVNLAVETMTADFDNSLISYIQSPQLWPDLVWVPAEYHTTFSANGHFVNLKPMLDEAGIDLTDDFYPEIINTTHYNLTDDDGVWFAPRDYNKPVIFYNKDMFRIAGITDEELDGFKKDGWTMDQFLAVCKRIRTKMDNASNTLEEKNAGMLTTSYPIDADLNWAPSYRSFIAEFGGELIDTSKTGADAISIATKASKDAYKDIYSKMIRPRYCLSSDTSSIFRNRASAMWVTVRPELQAVVNLGIDVDFLPMPTSGVAVGCSGYAIPKASQNIVDPTGGNTKTNAEWAFEFIEYVLSVDGQNLLGRTGTGVPVRKSLAENGDWRQYLPNANHDAFVSYPAKDLPQTDFYIFDAEDHKAIRAELDSIPLTFSNPQMWVNSPFDSTRPGSSWKTFEDAIAKIRANMVSIIS